MSNPRASRSPQSSQNVAFFAKKLPRAVPSPASACVHASMSGKDATDTEFVDPGGVGVNRVHPPSTLYLPRYILAGHPQYTGMWHDDSSAAMRSSRVSKVDTISLSSATGPLLNPTRFWFLFSFNALSSGMRKGAVIETWSLPPPHRTCASFGRLSRRARSSTAPTRPTTPFSRQSRRMLSKIWLPSSGAMPHACMAATSAPADAPATGVSGVMSPRSRRTCHAPTWYGKIIPAAEKPTPSTALSVLATSMGDDDARVVTRAARFPATPRPPGARLCARDKATLGAFGASEALMVCEASKGAFLCAFQCESGAGLPEPLICREIRGGLCHTKPQPDGWYLGLV